MAPWPLGYFDAVYGMVAAVLGAWMLWLSVQVFRIRTGGEATRQARRLFGFSIVYLFALFATLLGEAVVTSAMRMAGQ